MPIAGDDDPQRQSNPPLFNSEFDEPEEILRTVCMARNEAAFSGRPDDDGLSRESSVNPHTLPVRCNAWLGASGYPDSWIFRVDACSRAEMPLESVELASSVKGLAPNAGHDFDSAGETTLISMIGSTPSVKISPSISATSASVRSPTMESNGAGRLTQATGDQHAEDEANPADAPNEEVRSGRPDRRRAGTGRAV